VVRPQYQSGTDAHLDWAFSPILNDKFHIGAVGYFYNQITGDSGTGARSTTASASDARAFLESLPELAKKGIKCEAETGVFNAPFPHGLGACEEVRR
jgi:hypothetical protein